MSVRNYAILWPDRKSVSSTAGGGNQLLSTGVHELDGPEHTHLDAYVKATLGGEEGFFDHGATGTTETIDPAVGNWHAITLDDDCSLTITDARSDKGNSLLIEVTQDGVGGRVLTLPGNVVNAADLEASQDTTANAISFLLLIQRDGATWYGFWAGGGGSALTVSDEGTPLATAATSLDFVGSGVTASGITGAKTITIPGGAADLDDLSDVTITAPAENDTLRYVSGVWINDTRKYEVVTNGEDIFVWEDDELVHEFTEA